MAILLIALAGLVLALRFAYFSNRIVGVSLIAIVGLGSSYFLFLQFSAERRYHRLLAELKLYNDVTIGREFFPLPRISRISIRDGIADSELATILDLDGLDDLSELYLDNGELTDASLTMVASKLNLNYIFIDCNKITDAAILEYENRYPNCTVIAYKRDLHDDGVDVYLGPPPIGK